MTAEIHMTPAKSVAGNQGSDMRLTMGDGPPVLTQGFGGMWETISRSRKVAITRFVGASPIGQDIPIFLDRFRADPGARVWLRDKSIQAQLNKLLRQSVPRGGHAPTVWRIKGPIHYPRKRWIIADIEFGDSIRDPINGLVRQAATLKLMEYVPPDRIKVKRRKTVAPEGKKNVYKSRKGDTLRSIARQKYGDGSLAKQLGKAQKKPIRDVGKRLEPGTKIRLPRLLGKGYK